MTFKVPFFFARSTIARTINLVLVDDHQVVRTSLKTFLASIADLQVIGEAEDGESAIHIVREKQPDVVVMDITMPGMDGLEASRRIRITCPESKILALTIHDDKQYFFEMLSAGATGYLTKQAAAEELVEAIRALASGYVYLQPALARWLLSPTARLVLGTVLVGVFTTYCASSACCRCRTRR